MKIGILGGTFDPIHLGHLRTAEEIGQGLNLEKVYLIPSASPPHKTKEPVTSFHHRLSMARAAVGDSRMLEALDLESRRPGLSYSIETLRELRTIFSPKADLFFILGTDAFSEIKTWKDYQRLFNFAHFVIIHRAGFKPDRFEALLADLSVDARKTQRPYLFTAPSGKTIMLMEPTLMDISSTRIRAMNVEGKSIRFLVPESVRNYIMKNGLYRDNGNP